MSEHGDFARASMKKELAEEWRALNRRRVDKFDLFIFWACLIAAVLVAACFISLAIVHGRDTYQFFKTMKLKESTHARIRSADKNQLEVLEDRGR